MGANVYPDPSCSGRHLSIICILSFASHQLFYDTLLQIMYRIMNAFRGRFAKTITYYCYRFAQLFGCTACRRVHFPAGGCSLETMACYQADYFLLRITVVSYNRTIRSTATFYSSRRATFFYSDVARRSSPEGATV